MTTSSQASHDSSSDRPNSSSAYALKSGLAALKRGHYEVAIAHLTTAEKTAGDRSSRVKARIGLVKAYGQVGRIEEAIALVRPLCDSSNEQVRNWATRALSQFTTMQAEGVAVDETGFVPLVQGRTALPIALEEGVTQGLNSTAAVRDGTGFIPLEEQSSPGEISQPNQRTDCALPAFPLAQSTATCRNPHNASKPLSAGQTDAGQTDVGQTDADQIDAGQIDTASPGQPASAELVEAALSDQGSMKGHSWKQAGRAQKWGSLGAVDLASLWALEAGSIVALIILTRGLAEVLIAVLNWYMQHVGLPLIDLREFVIYSEPLPWVVVVVLGLGLLSPWGMDAILRRVYGGQPMSLAELEGYSPEAVRLMGRVCRQRRCPMPALHQLPEATPLVLSYGLWPKLAHIVVSRGALEQLTDNEIATLYAAELNHLFRWDATVLSALVFVAQLPYLVYWQSALWGDRQRNRVLHSLAKGISSLGYGLFRLLRWPGLWLSRQRLIDSDRAATEMTGNPNGLVRALLKLSLAMADDVRHKGYTSPLLESLEQLLPVSPHTALTVGSVVPAPPWADCLAWDIQPEHRWLTLNQSHPLLGDRIARLHGYARQWRLEPEIDDVPAPASPTRSRLWLQMAPFLGGAVGLSGAGVLWLVGAIAPRMGLGQVAWMMGDRTILWGCLLTGLSIGSMIRINPFFPEIRFRTVQNPADLSALLTDPHRLPIDGQPIRLQGTLLGRRGLLNQLFQDVILQTPTGLIKLHHQTKVGPLGHVLRSPLHCNPNVPITVTGWWRRGATLWIDVHTLQAQQGPVVRGEHPIWATVLAIFLGLLGAAIILAGGW